MKDSPEYNDSHRRWLSGLKVGDPVYLQEHEWEPGKVTGFTKTGQIRFLTSRHYKPNCRAMPDGSLIGGKYGASIYEPSDYIRNEIRRFTVISRMQTATHAVGWHAFRERVKELPTDQIERVTAFLDAALLASESRNLDEICADCKNLIINLLQE